MDKRIVVLIGLFTSFIWSSDLSAQNSAQNKNITKSDSTANKKPIIFSKYRGDDAAKEYYMRGKEALVVDRDIYRAYEYFSLALKANPNHGASNYEFARMSKPEIGLDYSLRANKSDTLNQWYQDQLAEIYLKLNNVEKAIEIKSKSIKQRPLNQKNYRELAAYKFYNKDIDGAFALIDTVTNKFGDDPEVAIMHCNMIKSLPMTTENKDIIEGYANKYPDISDFTFILGQTYFSLKQYDLGVASLKRVKEINGDDLRGDIALFDYYNSTRQEREMIKYLPSVFAEPSIPAESKLPIYEQVISYNINLYRSNLLLVDKIMASLLRAHSMDTRVRKAYSDHLKTKGSMDLALQFNKESIELNVDDYSSYETIIEIYAYKNELDSLIKYIDIASEKFEDKTAELTTIKAFGYTQNKESDKAIKILKEGVKDITNDSVKSVFHTQLGDIYNAENKYKLAGKSYNRALKYDQTNITALNNYSYMLSETGKNLEKALTMSLMVINKEPSNPTFLDTYGWILYKLKRYKEARETLSKAVALDTNKSHTLMMHYGDTLYRLGLESLANEYWTKALEYGADKAIVDQRLKEGLK